MPNWTKNYNLRKPLPEEFYDINEHNSNMDIIDTELAKRASLDDNGKVRSEQLPQMDYIPNSEKGVASGVATLDSNGKVPPEQLPESSGGSGSGKRTVRLTIGSSQYGWTASDCDYLCDGTADEVEINTAIQSLRSTGGEIVLLDGLYNLSSQILMNKDGITLTGNGANTRIIRAFNDDEYSPDQGLILIKKSYCTIRNLYFDCVKGTYTANSTINLAVGNNCIIADNTIVNCSGDGIYIVGSYHTVDNNIIQNCFQGLYLFDSTKTTVTNNRIEEAQSTGVYLYNVEDIVLNNNVVENCGDSGIKFQNCNESTVVGNVCNYNAQCGIYITRGDNNVICGNTCNGNGNFAIYVGTTPKNNIFTANTYFDNSAGTISLGSTKNVTYSESDHKHDASDIVGGFETLAAAIGACKIETGSYTGTGTYGSSNPNILTFSFSPKFVLIHDGADSSTSYNNHIAVAVRGSTILSSSDEIGSGSNHLTWGDKSISWYYSGTGGGNEYYQLNGAPKDVYGDIMGGVYYWIAIG